MSRPDEVYECVDSLPWVAMSSGQALRAPGHWLWESQAGHGGTGGGFFVGDHLLASISPRGRLTGWRVGAASINDRWLLSAFLSARAGCPAWVAPPVGHVGAFQAVGQPLTGQYLGDQGFNSERGRLHWLTRYAAHIWSRPPYRAPARAAWSRQACLWLAAHRQIVETVFACLSQVFDIQHLNAHSRWGQYVRIAAKIAAYHLGLWLNHLLGRPSGALATLLT